MATIEPTETVPVVVIVYPCGCTYHARSSVGKPIGSEQLVAAWVEGERLKTCEDCRARDRAMLRIHL